MKNVLSKINWPTFREAAKLSAVAITVALVVGAFCWVIDSAVIALTKVIF